MKAVRLAGLLAVLAVPTLAQERPDEGSMFGESADAGSPPPPEASATSRAPAAAATPDPRTVSPEEPTLPNPSSRDTERLGGAAATNAFETGNVKEDPLKIGGQLYLRGFLQGTEHTPPSQSRFSLPTLLDVFLDARPTERLRAMVLGRLSYDPFLSTSLAGLPNTTSTPPANPSVALDQAWLTFDVEHRVFVTAGRQHVKWGTGHFFNPTDFLSSRRRDPLAQFDTRLGVSMVRANVPFATSGWNITGVALFEPTQAAGGLGIGGSSGSTGLPDSTSQGASSTGTTLGSVGGAARAEFQLGETAFGVDGLVQRGRKSRLGVDVSSPLGPLDVYAEALLSDGSDTLRYEKIAGLPPGVPVLAQYEALNVSGAKASATVGGSYTFPFQETKSITLGAEYFYNGLGYSDAHIYPVLILKGVYQPFYTGEHYLAVNASFTDPSAKTSYILSNIGNMTDQSYIARFDFIVTALSYLQVEAFADYHHGSRGGEFRFAFDSSTLNDPSVPVAKVEAPIFDVGLGLRLAL